MLAVFSENTFNPRVGMGRQSSPDMGNHLRRTIGTDDGRVFQ